MLRFLARIYLDMPEWMFRLLLIEKWTTRTEGRFHDALYEVYNEGVDRDNRKANAR